MHQNKSSKEKHVSLIIVGAGPTGLTMANLLGIAGIDTLILERNSGLSDFPKAIAIDDEGLRICQAMGLLEPMLQHVLLDVSADYLTGKRLLSRVAPTAKRNGFPLISTFQQPEFEAILLAGLQRFTCVSITFQHNVEAFEQDEQRILVSIRTPGDELQKITCDYLLACDGGKSSIRRALGVPMQGSTFAQKWLVVDSIGDEHPSKTVTFFCNPQRPSVSVPSPQQCRRWEFMLLPGEQEEDLLRPETIDKLIHQIEGTHHPQIVRRAIYTFHAVVAEIFSEGRVFLLGDAAHQMPPFGGQGMNSGLRDAHNLSWKLSLVLQGLASPSLLNTYNEERREHSAQMIGMSRFAGNVVMPTAKHVALFRDTIFFVINIIPAAREYFTEMRIKPQPRYKKGFVLSRAEGLKRAPLRSAEAVGAINRPLRSRADKSAVGAIMGFFTWRRSRRRGRFIAPTADLSASAGLLRYFVTSHNRSLAGLMLPQPEVTTLQGEKVLLDEVLGSGFALLCYSDEPGALHTRVEASGAGISRAGASSAPNIYGHRSMVGAPLAGALDADAVGALPTGVLDAVPGPDIWAQLGVRFICVQPTRPTGPESIALSSLPTHMTIIRSNEISTFLRHDPDLFVLVRPDRYIFGAFRREQEAAFASLFRAKLQS